MRIKLNDMQTIYTLDARNLVLETTTTRTIKKDGKDVEQKQKQKHYFSTVGQALRAAAREFPLLSKAKTPTQLKNDYEAFCEELENILTKWELPDSRAALNFPEDLELGRAIPIGSKRGDGSYNHKIGDGDGDGWEDTGEFDELGNKDEGATDEEDDWTDDGEDWTDDGEDWE